AVGAIPLGHVAGFRGLKIVAARRHSGDDEMAVAVRGRKARLRPRHASTDRTEGETNSPQGLSTAGGHYCSLNAASLDLPRWGLFFLWFRRTGSLSVRVGARYENEDEQKLRERKAVNLTLCHGSFQAGRQVLCAGIHRSSKFRRIRYRSAPITNQPAQGLELFSSVRRIDLVGDLRHEALSCPHYPVDWVFVNCAWGCQWASRSSPDNGTGDVHLRRYGAAAPRGRRVSYPAHRWRQHRSYLQRPFARAAERSKGGDQDCGVARQCLCHQHPGQQLQRHHRGSAPLESVGTPDRG